MKRDSELFTVLQ